MTNHMPVMSGRILPRNTPVSVLRDTGCSTCVIKSSLVKPEQMTGDHSKVTLIDSKGISCIKNRHCFTIYVW